MRKYTDEERKWLDGLTERRVAPPELPYEQKLVAFIDILGVKDKVLHSGDEALKIMTMMGKIRKFVDGHCHDVREPDKIQLLQIGDGFYIVADFCCVNEMCGVLAEIQWQTLLECKELIRGSLTAGNVSVDKDKNFFIGQAIVEAFELERSNAIFPRIIYEHKTIEEQLVKAGQDIDIDYKYIIDDQDKVKYIDYIRYNIDNKHLDEDELNRTLEERAVCKTLNEEYQKLGTTNNKIAAQKYGWLISKLEEQKVKVI